MVKKYINGFSITRFHISILKFSRLQKFFRTIGMRYQPQGLVPKKIKMCTQNISFVLVIRKFAFVGYRIFYGIRLPGVQIKSFKRAILEVFWLKPQ